MRDILRLCVEVDSLAQDTYKVMAESADDDRLRDVFARMAEDERAHRQWWEELVGAWENGLLPDIFNDTEEIKAKLDDLADEIRAEVPEDVAKLSRQEMLTLAARIEFFMLHPAFGELLDLVEPDSAHTRHRAYTRHVERLVKAIEEYSDDSSLAAFLARVLRMSWDTNQALAKWAMRDALTGLYNRRALEAHLKQWTAWAARYGRPLAVLMIDADDFKSVNDRFGHTVGDQVLEAIAAALRRSVRSSDVLARWGGDEFVVLAPETTGTDLEQLASRILAETRSAGVAHDGRPVDFSVSIGTTVLREPDGRVPPLPEDVIAAADRSLYEAKEAGRDRYARPVALAEV